MNYGYEGEILLPVRVTPSAGLRAGDTLTLAARADWLVCKEDCVPGETDLTLALPVRDAAPPRSHWAPLFDATRALLPRQAPGIKVEALRHQGRLELRLTSADGGPVLAGRQPGTLSFFPADAGLIENAADQPLSFAPDALTLALEKSHQRREPVERLRGTLVAFPGFAPDAAPALAIDVAVREALPPGDGGTAVDDGRARASE